MKFDRWLRDTVLVQDKGEHIVSITFSLKTKHSIVCFIGDLCPVLRRAFLFMCFDNNLLRVKDRPASLIPQLYRNVVVEAIVRGAKANVSRTHLHSAAEA